MPSCIFSKWLYKPSEEVFQDHIFCFLLVSFEGTQMVIALILLSRYVKCCYSVWHGISNLQERMIYQENAIKLLHQKHTGKRAGHSQQRP